MLAIHRSSCAWSCKREEPGMLMQASCNDWHLGSELSSAYLLEKLVGSMHRAGVEDGPPSDGAHMWVESPHATLEPCKIDQSLGAEDPRVNGTWQRPWADECKVRTAVLLLCCPSFWSALRASSHDCCYAAIPLYLFVPCVSNLDKTSRVVHVVF